MEGKRTEMVLHKDRAARVIVDVGNPRCLVGTYQPLSKFAYFSKIEG
jgi:hypothetical protein